MASPENQNLARRLVTFEAAHSVASTTRGDVAERVIQELRLRLVKLAGPDGFRSLLSRALTLARAESPSLQSVQVQADGSLTGLDGTEKAEEAGIILVAHLLELLVSFIGESLTLHLVRDAWPEAAMNSVDFRTEEKP